jgi:hypothetical protein
MAKINEARGEVACKIGSVELVLCATMENLATLSAALGTKSFPELWGRLSNADPMAVLHGVRCLAVSGDVEKAVGEFHLRHMEDALAAIGRALNDPLEADNESEGKPEAAKAKS